VSDSSGSIVHTRKYDEYENGGTLPSRGTGLASDLPIEFAGGISDSVTGRIRFWVCDYDPVIGRWTAKDPILFQGGQANLYAYIKDNFIDSRDPQGLGIVEMFLWALTRLATGDPIGAIGVLFPGRPESGFGNTVTQQQAQMLCDIQQQNIQALMFEQQVNRQSRQFTTRSEA
jgi:RHS repeat-associated protein